MSKLLFMIPTLQCTPLLLKNYRYLNVIHKYTSNVLCVASFTCKNSKRHVFMSSGLRKKNEDFSSLFIPVTVNPSPANVSVGEELTGKIKKKELLSIINDFGKSAIIRELCKEHGLTDYLFHQTFLSFRHYCLESKSLPADIHIIISDIIHGGGHVNDIFPYFMRHARNVFPHLECIEELQKIGDLRSPPLWYPDARSMQRKLIFHAGPTNSGKTYHALKRFMDSKSGVYCGPLKLLAQEIYQKCNEQGTPCDLVTGEERRFAVDEDNLSTHVACTIEMSSITHQYEVAVIDEIQMLRDPQRGWAWTRALLGLRAEEVHLCGEEAAINVVKDIALAMGEEFELQVYKRLTPLTVEKKHLKDLTDVEPGDCIVCFSKNDIYAISRILEKENYQCAVIYGGLPPGTKLAQARRFNDPEDPCKILVTTDAVGMGLNLSIRRIIFYSLLKASVNVKGEKEMNVLTVSQAKQIAGRAGRYGTQFENGFVTTFRKGDLTKLQSLLDAESEAVTKVGLHPTAEQMEMYAYHLPKATLSNLMDIFVSLSTIDDSRYFLCHIEDFKFLADMIQHIPLSLRERYVFCCAPIDRKSPYICTMFLKIVRQYSRNENLTFDWLCRQIGWPFSPPENLKNLVHMEGVHDVLDVYLWLSYRFPDLFTDVDLIRDMQRELDNIIQMGVINISRLLKNSETNISSRVGEEDDDSFNMKVLRQRYKETSRVKVDFLDRAIDSLPLSDVNKNLLNKEEEAIVEDSVGLNNNEAPETSSQSGKLSNLLLLKGLVTPEQLAEIKKELMEEIEKEKWMKTEEQNQVEVDEEVQSEQHLGYKEEEQNDDFHGVEDENTTKNNSIGLHKMLVIFGPLIPPPEPNEDCMNLAIDLLNKHAEFSLKQEDVVAGFRLHGRVPVLLLQLFNSKKWHKFLNSFKIGTENYIVYGLKMCVGVPTQKTVKKFKTLKVKSEENSPTITFAKNRIYVNETDSNLERRIKHLNELQKYIK